MSITIDKKNAEAIIRRIESIDKRAGHALIKKAVFVLEQKALRAFARGRSPYGARWRRLKNPSKKRGGASAKPLRDTGALQKSLTARAGHKRGRLGYGVAHARYHQFGTSRGIPARPILPLTRTRGARLPNKWQAAMDKAVSAEIRKIIKG